MGEYANKDTAGKTRWDLMPPRALEEVARVFTYGAEKYAPRGWERGMPWGQLFGAAQRHLWAFWDGEDYDCESGLLHLAHAAWNVLALLEYQVSHIGFDDRSIRGRQDYSITEDDGCIC